jgi:hypothetical protein
VLFVVKKLLHLGIMTDDYLHYNEMYCIWPRARRKRDEGHIESLETFKKIPAPPPNLLGEIYGGGGEILRNPG